MAKKVAAPAKKVAAPAKKGAPAVAKQATATAAKKAPAPAAKSTSTASKKPAPPKAPPAKAPSKPPKAASAKAAPAATKETPVTPQKKATATAVKKAPAAPAGTAPSPIKGETKEGIKYTKDFDAKFLTNQYKLLIEAREQLTGQAVRLEDEANSLIDDEMGDVQFDDESGEGDTMVVERERDLFLSARARQDIEEIDAALSRLKDGTYGYSVVSLRPIPRERLEAIPWATELTEEKVGGIGRR